MTPLLYVLTEGIDLGDAIHGVFTTREKAYEALDRMTSARKQVMGTPPYDLQVSEFPADQIVCESWWWKKANP